MGCENDLDVLIACHDIDMATKNSSMHDLVHIVPEANLPQLWNRRYHSYKIPIFASIFCKCISASFVNKYLMPNQ